jgi:RNA polymerase sigma-70 factor (ECF subfamily)
MAALDAIPSGAIGAYQAYWALRAHLLRSLGRAGQAREAYARAIGLSEDAAVREFLVNQSSALSTA